MLPRFLILQIFHFSGGEFKNAKFQNYCKKNQIKNFYSKISKPALVERLNRSIQSIIYRYCTQNQTFKFYDKLPDLIHTYNSRTHRMIGISPLLAEKEENFAKVRLNMEKTYMKNLKRRKPKFKKGDFVKVSLLKKTFSKGFDIQNQEELFVISNVDTRFSQPLYEVC